MRMISKFRRACERDGFFGAWRLAVRNLVVMPAVFRPPAKKTWFDEKYGVDTDTWVDVEDLGVSGPSKTFAVGYAPTPVKVWEDAMALLSIVHHDFLFIDLGSGKGRALMLAAGYPFQQIIGVEFSPALHMIAMRNIEIYSGPSLCSDIRCVFGDAAAFGLPDSPLVILIANPFVGDIMRQVVGNIEKSVNRSPRHVYVLYVKPIHAESLNQSQVLREIAHTDHCRIFASGK
jgi:SAM-dependent methyltransferase